MQFTILSVFFATLLNVGSVEADVKECQDIKSKFLECTTKWDIAKSSQAHHNAGPIIVTTTNGKLPIKKWLIKKRCRAHETFKEQISIGSDGRPDFAARKACNYMESAIQVLSSSTSQLKHSIQFYIGINDTYTCPHMIMRNIYISL